MIAQTLQDICSELTLLSCGEKSIENQERCAVLLDNAIQICTTGELGYEELGTFAECINYGVSVALHEETSHYYRTTASSIFTSQSSNFEPHMEVFHILQKANQLVLEAA